MPSAGPVHAMAMASIARMRREGMTSLRASLDTRFTRERRPRQPLLRCVQRVLAPLVELVLQPQTFLVRLHGADRLHDGIDPRLRFELAELARRDATFSRVVIRESCVPPDAGVQTLRQLHARLIGTRFLR